MMYGFVLVMVLLLLGIFLSSTQVRANQPYSPLDHYKGQLNELENDIQSGVIDGESAVPARLEIERRILRAAAFDTTSDHSIVADLDGVSSDQGLLLSPVALGAGVLVMIFSVIIYSLKGSPSLESSPGVRIQRGAEHIIEGGPTINQAIKQIQKRLKENPADAKGYEILGRTAGSIGEYSISANAYMSLIALQPQEPRWQIQALETMLSMSGGAFAPASKMMLSRLLENTPDHPAGQFYLGVMYARGGNFDQARGIWTALKARSAPNAPWLSDLNNQLANLPRQLNQKFSMPQLTQEQIQEVEAMPAQERGAFLESMVMRLEEKVQQNPNDLEGWLMLIRSFHARGQLDKARESSEKALAVFSGNQKALSAIQNQTADLFTQE